MAVVAAVDAGGDVIIAWQPAARRGDGETIVQTETSLGATFDDAGLHVRHRFRFRVRQGSLADVRIAVPAGVNLRAIRGADVGGWEQAAEGDARNLRIFFRRDVTDATDVEVDLFVPLDVAETATTIAVPQLVPEGVTRESGEVVVFAAPQLSVQAQEATGLRQINLDVTPMDESLSLPDATPRVAYRFASRPFALSVAVSRRLPQTRVVSQHGAQLALRKTRLASGFQFDLRDAPRAALSFLLPADYLTLDVQADYLADWYLTETAEGRLLTVALDQPRTGQLQVFLEGSVARDAAAASVSILVPRAIDVQRNDSQLAIWVDDSYTATVGSPADWRPLDPAQLDAKVRSLREGLPQFAFRSTQLAPGSVDVALVRSVPSFAADAVVLTAVSDASIDYGLNLRWTIENAAADTLAVSLPEWLGDKLEFQGQGLRQVQSQLLASGDRLWRISLQQPVRGQYLLSAVATIALPADDAVRTPDVRFILPDRPLDAPEELTVQRRFLVLVNLSGAHRLVPVDAAAIEPAQRDRLPLVMKPELLDQAVEIASLRVGSPLPQWRLEAVGGEQAASAIVLLADLRTVLDYDGSWRTQADYRVRNRGRQFLAVRPPEKTRLLSVVVRGVPSQATLADVAGAPALLVPLPATSAADLSFDVRLVLAGQLPRALPRQASLAGVDVELPAPQVVAPRDSPEFGLPVMQTLWRVDLPDGLHATIVDGGTNLNPGGESAAAGVYDRSLLDEVRQQLSSIGNLREKARKSQSQEHLHNLAITVRDLERLSTEGKKIAEDQSQVLESARQTLKELSDQQAVEGVESQESLARNDFGRNFIIDNNADIANLNGIAIFSDSDGVTTFNYIERGNSVTKAEKAPAGKPMAGGRALAADEAKSRAGAKSQLSRQELGFARDFRAPAASQQPATEAEGFYARQQRMGQSAVQLQLEIRHQQSQTRAFLADAEFAQLDFGDASGVAAPAAGGLSLPVTLPDAGHRLTFTKNGGDPRLTLSVRPRESFAAGLGLIWAAVWIGGALWGTSMLQQGRLDSSTVAARLLLVFGLLGTLLLPGAARYAALAAFVLGCGWLLARRVLRPEA
jgi:hypothetical protein